MTKIISGFPGIGKSYLYNKTKLKVSDSDSSKFDKKDFPENYIKHIKELFETGEYDIILLSSHQEVRESLDKNELNFYLVYPEKYLKSEYIKRYKDRGSDEKFVSMMKEQFDNFVEQCETFESDFVTKIPLTTPSESLESVLDSIL